MPPSATTTRQNSLLTPEPTLWQRYSPSGELPLASAASLAAHTFTVLLVVAASMWLLGSDADEGNKPPRMDLVEIEGEGGGLGGLASGAGKLDSGPPGRTEGAPNAKGAGNSLPPKKPKDGFKFADPKINLILPGDPAEGPIVDEGDAFKKLQMEQDRIAKFLREAGDSPPGNEGPRPGFKGGDKDGSPGGAGGKKGPGIGKGKGAGEGTSPFGEIVNKNRKRETRWHINASSDGAEHLKKLQALKVTLLVLPSKPGQALKYDLSKPTLVPQRINFVDDKTTVRYYSVNPSESAALAKQLKLTEPVRGTAIYLPPDLVERMAKIEQQYSGRLENEILKTVWDVRERDGLYDNEPYIVEQILRGGVK